MRYLVWSNRYGGWLRPHRNGYTGSLDEAGYFEVDEAGRIAAMENCGGPVERSDPFTGRRYAQHSAVVMAAPEVLVTL